MAIPTLAVVIASTGSRARLSAYIAALLPRCLRTGAELIVVRADPRSVAQELSAANPNVRFVPAPPGTSAPDLRIIGFGATPADVVALVDDAGEHAPFGGALDALCAAGHRPSTDPGHRPRISVIVPAHQDGATLDGTLEALAHSDLARDRWELIVVDDASTDDTARIAARRADVVVRLPGRRRGPAYARNRGVELARGEYLAFIDPDVCVRPDTLSRFVATLDDEPVGAVFGSLDAGSVRCGLVSQWRNLLTCYYHQRNPGEAETFWASCGAIRRSAFADAGMFDEWHFRRRQVEDSELGNRLRRRGHQIVLRPEIQAAHLRRWTLRGMIAAELRDRTVPWMRTVDRNREPRERAGHRPRRTKRWNTALTWVAVALLVGALVSGARSPLLAAGLCLGMVLLNTRDQYRFLARERGAAFTLSVVPLDLLSYLVNGVAVACGWLLREVMGPSPPAPTVEAYAEVGVQMWPPVPVPVSSRGSGATEGSISLGMTALPSSRGSEATEGSISMDADPSLRSG